MPCLVLTAYITLDYFSFRYKTVHRIGNVIDFLVPPCDHDVFEDFIRCGGSMYFDTSLLRFRNDLKTEINFHEKLTKPPLEAIIF